jgi:hypothetical protein
MLRVRDRCAWTFESNSDVIANRMGRKVVGNSGQRPFAPAALPLTKGLHDSSATQSGAPWRAVYAAGENSVRGFCTRSLLVTRVLVANCTCQCDRAGARCRSLVLGNSIHERSAAARRGFPILHTRLGRLLRGALISRDPTSPEETLLSLKRGYEMRSGHVGETAPR